MAGADNHKYLGFTKATYYRKQKRAEQNRLARDAILKDNATFGYRNPADLLSNQTNSDAAVLDHPPIYQITNDELFSSTVNQRGVQNYNSHSTLGTFSTLGTAAPKHSPIFVSSSNQVETLTFRTKEETLMTTLPKKKSRKTDFNLNDMPAVLEICKVASRHSITDECLEDILKLLHNPSVLCKRNNVPKTSRGFESGTGVADMIITISWQCTICKGIRKKSMFQNEDAPDLSCCGVKCTYHQDHYVIFDGSQILQLVLMSVDTGFVEKMDDLSLITLTLNTDGAPLFKGSKSSIWPLLGAVDKTYFNTRKENMILFGIYVGIQKSTKPDFDVFLEPIVETLQHLHAHGLDWKRSDETPQHSKIEVTAVVCDSIARPCVQKLTQFNGKYGCGYCYHDQPGHFFRHIDISNIKWRDNRNYCLDVIGTICNEEDVRGVKGQCPLWKLPGFDIIYGFPPDVMHTVYLGVTRHLLEAWTNTSNFKMPFYLDQSKQQAINNLIQNIKPPQRVSRTPRTLDNLKHYKAHDFMMFLLYYSPVILETVLERRYFDHWLKLVRGIAILTSSFVIADSIRLAETLLNEFSSEIESLYGEKHQRFNVHLLLHLGEFVRRNGPLQNYCMAAFESFNMVLQKYGTSSNGVGRQICKRYFRDVIVKSTEACLKENLPNTDVMYQPLDSVDYQPSIDEAVKLRLCDGLDTSFKFFCRLKVIKFKSTVVMHSEMYSKTQVRDSTNFILEENHHIFRTKVFAFNESSKKCYAIGTCFQVCLSSTFTLPHCYDVVNSIPLVVEVPNNPEIVLHIQTDIRNIYFKFLNDAEAISE